MAKARYDLARSHPTPEVNEKTAETLINIDCDRETGPYVITTSLMWLQSSFLPGSSQPRVVAAALLDETRCPAARSLPEYVKSILLQYPRAPAPTTPTQ
jgi:hypothetical protein